MYADPIREKFKLDQQQRAEAIKTAFNDGVGSRLLTDAIAKMEQSMRHQFVAGDILFDIEIMKTGYLYNKPCDRILGDISFLPAAIKEENGNVWMFDAYSLFSMYLMCYIESTIMVLCERIACKTSIAKAGNKVAFSYLTDEGYDIFSSASVNGHPWSWVIRVRKPTKLV